MSMTPEENIATGMSIKIALAAFRESVNQPGTIFSTDHWLLPKLHHLQHLLTEPITEEEAEALLDVLHQRHWMADLFEWLEKRPVRWNEFFTYRKEMHKEELRKRAEERKRRHDAQGERDFELKLFPEEFYLKLPDACPDCDSTDWRPIAYGLPTEATREDARLGDFVLGGCVFTDPTRYCVACFNRWPTKPKGRSRRDVIPEWIKRGVVESRSAYARLSELADLTPGPDEPFVERAWARIDGTVRFLVSHGSKKAEVTKAMDYVSLDGAPTYSSSYWMPHNEDDSRASMLAKVAAIRFERSRTPEQNNLYNQWDKVQAHHRALDRMYEQSLQSRQREKEDREKLSRLLKLARAASEKLPAVIGIRSSGGNKTFNVRFSWGDVRIERFRFTLLEPPYYQCSGSFEKAEDRDLAEDLAYAAVLLADFPRLDLR